MNRSEDATSNGRRTETTPSSAVVRRLDGARVLITGGTGSFGSAMARRLLTGSVEELRILSRDENKQDSMRRTFGDDRLRFYLGDVRDLATVEKACRGVDYVFHAAALKQVPSCEFFPLEALRTNVVGSANVIDAAHANDVRSVVCLSTDKAVYPINAMGMTKALMEKVAQAFTRNGQTAGTTVSTVRYGNVLYSRGSVVPLFIEQVKAGRPLTITDPDMTRFLMSLAEAVALVEHAFVHATPGDLFVRKAPASTVQVLAEAVRELFGAPNDDIQVIGTRHGEKLYETLVSREEMSRAQDQGDFYRIPVDDRGLNYDIFFNEGDTALEIADEYTSHNTERMDRDGVIRALLDLPEVAVELAATGRTPAGVGS